MSTEVSKLAQRLAELRKEKGWTLQQLADKVELTRVTCGYYENDKRHPDAVTIVKFCEAFDVSADYLLGLIDTRKPEYAEIANTTRLTEEAIESLKSIGFERHDILSMLICDEPSIFLEEEELSVIELLQEDSGDSLRGKLQSFNQCYRDWHEEGSRKPILYHVGAEWEFNDCAGDDEKVRRHREGRADTSEYEDVPADSGDPPFEADEAEIAYYNEIGAMRAEHEAKEAKKSKLLSAIADYVAYQTGCTLKAGDFSEELTAAHNIRIGIGASSEVVFPSKETDELLEFAMMQRVIKALQVFKENYYAEEQPRK